MLPLLESACHVIKGAGDQSLDIINICDRILEVEKKILNDEFVAYSDDKQTITTTPRELLIYMPYTDITKFISMLTDRLALLYEGNSSQRNHQHKKTIVSTLHCNVLADVNYRLILPYTKSTCNKHLFTWKILYMDKLLWDGYSSHPLGFGTSKVIIIYDQYSHIIDENETGLMHLYNDKLFKMDELPDPPEQITMSLLYQLYTEIFPFSYNSSMSHVLLTTIGDNPLLFEIGKYRIDNMNIYIPINDKHLPEVVIDDYLTDKYFANVFSEAGKSIVFCTLCGTVLYGVNYIVKGRLICNKCMHTRYLPNNISELKDAKTPINIYKFRAQLDINDVIKISRKYPVYVEVLKRVKIVNIPLHLHNKENNMTTTSSYTYVLLGDKYIGFLDDFYGALNIDLQGRQIIKVKLVM